MGKCICGAKVKIPHTGDCHFGWHNPDTCPQLKDNKITAAEKREIEEMIRDTIINDIRVFTGADKKLAALATDSIIKYLDSIGYDANV